MRHTPHHGAPRRPLGPTRPAERVLPADGHAALNHRTIGLQALTHRYQPQAIQAQESRQISSSQGSLRHVEVLTDGLVKQLPSSGDLDPYPRNDAPTPPPTITPTTNTYHTPKHEEPPFDQCL